MSDILNYILYNNYIILIFCWMSTYCSFGIVCSLKKNPKRTQHSEQTRQTQLLVQHKHNVALYSDNICLPFWWPVTQGDWNILAHTSILTLPPSSPLSDLCSCASHKSAFALVFIVWDQLHPQWCIPSRMNNFDLTITTLTFLILFQFHSPLKVIHVSCTEHTCVHLALGLEVGGLLINLGRHVPTRNTRPCTDSLHPLWKPWLVEALLAKVQPQEKSRSTFQPDWSWCGTEALCHKDSFLRVEMC